MSDQHLPAKSLSGPSSVSPMPAVTLRVAPPHIPMSAPDISAAEYFAVHEVLASPILSMGQKLRAFEEAAAAYTSTNFAAAVSSGTSGLHLAVLAAGVKDGDLVITTPFSFVASANCILYERAIPVFVDVDISSGNIDPEKAIRAIEQIRLGLPGWQELLPPSLRTQPFPRAASRLKAILPVHTFGQPADLDPILAAAQKHGLAVIEDACEAIGAEYKGRKAGTLGDAGVFAFYPNKQMTTGEGGMLVTNHATWDRLFRSLRNQGRDEFNAWLSHTRLGYNYRLDEMSAALGLAQIRRIEELLARREQVARWYNHRLWDSELIQLPVIAPSTTRMSWFVYVVRLHSLVNRDELIRQLDAVGIPSRPYFTPIHLQPFYRQMFGYESGEFPITEYLGDQSLALPFSGKMTEDQVDYVCQSLIKVTARMAAGRIRS